ncbi:Sulfate adenylyltransferase subunit 1 [Buchnera aphidicola (Thelaxes suberi)]|uniref:sulfate adenylyltransferase subunit CysN n=1 Tax=Buchnera aphidicola TaxID=9 RepID=UPI00346385AE
MNNKINDNKTVQQLSIDFLNLNHNKNILRFLTCGSVDDGKSTLIGRLLHDTKQIYSDQLISLQNDSKRHGTQGNNVDYALLVDGLQAEIEQGITIDVAYRYFYTKKRKFIIADTPGHAQYTCNMVTGASTCDLAVLLVDAKKGLLEQTFRHAFIAKLLGIRYLLVAINKMDTVRYQQEIFNAIKKKFSEFIMRLSSEISVYFIPISALNGENIVFSNNFANWYKGKTLLQFIENIEINNSITNKRCMCFPIQYVNRLTSDFRGYAGTVAQGTLSIGQHVKILPSNHYSVISNIITYDRNFKKVESNHPVTITLKDNLDISRGDVLVDSKSIISVTKKITATIVWMSSSNLRLNSLYDIKINHKKTRGLIRQIYYVINITNLQKENANSLSLNEIGVVEINFDELIVCDTYKNNKTLGGFIIIDPNNNETIGAGMIKNILINQNILNVSHTSTFEDDLKKIIKKHFPHWNI